MKNLMHFERDDLQIIAPMIARFVEKYPGTEPDLLDFVGMS